MKTKLSLLIAPLHYTPSPDEGSEYTRAYDYLSALALNPNLSGDVLVAYMSEQKIGNFQIHSMLHHKPGYVSIFLRLRFILWVYLKGIRLFSQRHYDLLWHNGPFALGETFSLLILAKAKQIPTLIGPIVAPHTYLAADEGRSMGKKSYASSMLAKLLRLVDSLLYHLKIFTTKLSHLTLRRASLVIAKDHAAHAIIASLSPRRLTQLTIGPNTKTFLGKPRQLLRRKHYTVIAVGYLVRRKDFATVIEAFNHLVNQQNYHLAQLKIIGDGPELSHLTKLVQKYGLEKYVQFVGHVPKKEISGYYQRSHLFVSGSLSESMPAMYLEAMAAALPMVIASNSTASELAKHNFGGRVVPAKDPQKLAEAIQLLLTNAPLYNNYSARNYALSTSQFSFERQLKKLVDLLYITSRTK